MKSSVNDVTGNTEIQFDGKLISMSNTTQTLNNEKQTPYRVATIEFVNAEGTVKQVSALCYEGNFKYGLSLGTTYQCRAIVTPGQAQPLITISHLAAGERASFDDFGVSATSAVNVDAEAFTDVETV